MRRSPQVGGKLVSMCEASPRHRTHLVCRPWDARAQAPSCDAVQVMSLVQEEPHANPEDAPKVRIRNCP
jgi:hypothetical protein